MTNNPTNTAGDLVTVPAVVDFAKWAIRESAFAASDLDGGCMQEKAVELGLLVETVYDPETHGPSDVGEPGMAWFVFSPALSASPAHATGAMREALEAAAVWHDAQDKAISKQPNANVGHNGWMRNEHQEQASLLRAALSPPAPEGEAAPVRAEADGVREAADIIRRMVELADMGLEESLRQPEENGNFAIYERAKRFLDARSPEGETGPAVADGMRDVSIGALLKGNAAPSPSERGQHQGETLARPTAEWHEDYGFVTWWCWRNGRWLGEPAWIGTPNDSDWPDYHTHWTPHPRLPTPPALSTPEPLPVADKREGG